MVAGIMNSAISFSIRRRHTTSDRDWSSDVCSSDLDRKSTRLNSSHDQISYAVFCLKTKKDTADLHRRSDTISPGLPANSKYDATSQAPDKRRSVVVQLSDS